MKMTLQSALQLLGLAPSNRDPVLVEKRYQGKRKHFSSPEHLNEGMLQKLDEAYRVIVEKLPPQPLNAQVLLNKLDLVLNTSDKETKESQIASLQNQVCSQFGEAALACLNRLLQAFNLDDLCQLFFHVEQNGDPKKHAEKLSLIFDDPKAGFKYLLDFSSWNSNCNRNEVVHEACLFDLPEPARCHFAEWKKLAQKHLLNRAFRDLLGHAAAIERVGKIGQLNSGLDFQAIDATKEALKKAQRDYDQVDSQARGLSRDARELKRSALRTEINRLRQGLASLCQGCSFANLDIMTMQAFYEKYQSESTEAHKILVEQGINEQNIARFNKLERNNDDKAIPNLIIDGKNYGHPGFYLKKLDTLSDEGAALAACLGKLTDCCQYLGGAGDDCAVNGIESPNSGFYVLCQGDAENPSLGDRIFAQSWAWRSDSNGICLDSIEVRKDMRQHRAVIRSLYRVLAYQLCFDYELTAVTTSRQSDQVHYGLPALRQYQSCAAYKGYSDANLQSLLASTESFALFLREPVLFSRRSQLVQHIQKKLEVIFSNKQALKENDLLKLMVNETLAENGVLFVTEFNKMAKKYNRLTEWQVFYLDRLDQLHREIFGSSVKDTQISGLLPLLAHFKTVSYRADPNRKAQMNIYYNHYVNYLIDAESEKLLTDQSYRIDVLKGIIEGGLEYPFDHPCFKQPYDWSNRQDERVWPILVSSAAGERMTPPRHYIEQLLENCPDDAARQGLAVRLLGSSLSNDVMVNPDLFSKLLTHYPEEDKSNLAERIGIGRAASNPQSLRILLALFPDQTSEAKVLQEISPDDLCDISKTDNAESMKIILDKHPTKAVLLELIQTPRKWGRGETPLQYMTRKAYSKCIALILAAIPEDQKLAFLKIRLPDNSTMADYCLNNQISLPEDKVSYTRSFLALYKQVMQKANGSNLFNNPDQHKEIKQRMEDANTFEEFKQAMGQPGQTTAAHKGAP